MHKGNTLYLACTVVAVVEFAAPDRPDLRMVIRQIRMSGGRVAAVSVLAGTLCAIA